MQSQFDLRQPHRCDRSERVVLLDLTVYAGLLEGKCLAINARRTEQLAIGASDQYARLYDRRQLPQPHSLQPRQAPVGMPESAGVRYFCPGQCSSGTGVRGAAPLKAITSLAFSPLGDELLVNMSGEHIYLYDIDGQRAVQLLPDQSNKFEPENTAAAAKLPARAEWFKSEGNGHLRDGRLLDAIAAYGEAIAEAPSHAVPYLNRAVALMRRQYAGDVWAALRDCQQAVRLAPRYVKAHFRCASALLLLGHVPEAAEQLRLLDEQFPEQCANKDVWALRRDIERAQAKTGGSCDSSVASESARVREALEPKEVIWRAAAFDYEERFVGHCNTTTDIKQANFFGADGRFVIAGSDDGNFFVWDRQTGRITNVTHADGAIVNCVQPHPFVCLLATSGIDDVVRLWSPQPYSDEKTAYGPHLDHLTRQVPPRLRLDLQPDPECVFVSWQETVEKNQERMENDSIALDIADMMFYR